MGERPLSCKPCKPSSVPRPQAKPPSFIYDRSHLRPQATYPPTSDEQPLAVGIHGLATRQTYGRSVLLPPRWALTPPFHPYPCGRLFSVTLLHPHGRQVVSLDVALCCSDFPPPAETGSDGADLPPQRYKQSANSTIRPHPFCSDGTKSGRTKNLTPTNRCSPTLAPTKRKGFELSGNNQTPVRLVRLMRNGRTPRL